MLQSVWGSSSWVHRHLAVEVPGHRVDTASSCCLQTGGPFSEPPLMGGETEARRGGLHSMAGRVSCSEASAAP